MNDTNLTPEQVEALIAGTTRDQGLDELTTVIESLRSYQSDELDAALVDRIATGAANRAANSVADISLDSSGRTSFLSVSRRTFRRQIATVAATVTLVFASGTSVVFAADGASPGDALYGIDRALENVGIGDGGTEERLHEAEDLVAKGDVAKGLEHAAVAIAVATDDGDPDSHQAASAALELAAQRARASASDQTESSKAGVAALLEYLAGNIGHVDGNLVSELAQDIGKGPANNPSESKSQAPGQSKAADPESPPSNPGNGPDQPPGQTKKDSESPPSNPGNAPDEPPGQSGASGPDSPPSNPGNAPDEPPGQAKKNSQSNSDNSSKPEKTK